MAIVTETFPQGWRFDAGSGMVRDWVPEIAKNDQLQMVTEKAQFYDFDTIFYRVSYCQERGYFYAIGPKLLNFENLVLPMKARYSVDGGVSFTELDCTVRPPWHSLRNVYVQMPVPELTPGMVNLELELANGDLCRFKIEVKPPIRKRICINTQQKNNPVKWIIDWVLYYRSYGVFDFHIYDNNSDNVREVIDALKAEVPHDTAVQITHWPYRYGIVEIYESHWCQFGTINDFLLQSQSTDWVINCDIDEFIILGPEFTSLPDFFESLEDDVAQVAFGCSNAPSFRIKNYPTPITARDLEWRTRRILKKFKNAFRPDKTIVAGIHHLVLEKGYKQAELPLEQRFYLHALPLTTGWDSYRGLKRPIAMPYSRWFIRDTRVIERLESIDAEQARGDDH